MKRNTKIIFSIIVVVLIIVAAVPFYFLKNKNSATNVNNDLREIYLDAAKLKVEIADDPVSRSKGLSGRTKLAQNQGMLFIMDSTGIQSFWMKNTFIPLDMIWISGNSVVGITSNVQPEIGVSDDKLKVYTSPDYVDKVIEVNAGWSLRNKITIGSHLEW